jgi:hypothetical protein
MKNQNIHLGRIFRICIAVVILGSGSASAAVVYDADGDIESLTGVDVTISGVTTTYDVHYVFGTFDAVTTSSLGLSASWPYNVPTPTGPFNWMSAYINAIADELDAQGVGDAQFTNGTSDGFGSVNGFVPYDFGTLTTGSGTFGCTTCVQARGVWWTNSASGWSADGANSYILTTSSEAFLGPEVTWAVFIPTPPVPVPAAVWLFGSGLIGLVGVARRKTA